MNNKGFTLVELMAVLVVIGIVFLIGSAALGGTKGAITHVLDESNIGLIVNNARTYGQDIKNDIENSLDTAMIDGNQLNVVKVKVIDLKNDNHLEIDDKYDNLGLNLYIKDNRVYACVDKDENYDDLINIFENEDNLSYIDSYLCNKF